MKQCLLYVYSFNFINYLYIFSSSNISPVNLSLWPSLAFHIYNTIYTFLLLIHVPTKAK